MSQEPDQLAGIRAPQGQYAETSEVIEQHLIFLSHSGQEKDFTKKLDEALRSAGHNPFFDIYIPPAEEFDRHILQNAKECKLGVVVLSPGFLTSKWPMRELHLMHTSPSKPKILPLFFRVQPNDLNLSSPSFPDWRMKWQAFAESDPASISGEWEVAVTQLSKREGVVFKDNMTIDYFIEHAVERICSVIRPPVRYELSYLTGCTRLTEEVAKLFEEIPEVPLLKARAIGFYGIGGQGKTTICKLMVNHYASAYLGRCVLVEFPSNSCDKKEMVRQCNKALVQLANNGQASRHDDFDQCVQQMKDEVARRKVFIVLDNVWEVCLEFAQRILDVGFSTGSRVLVTSRSKEVLSNLLKESGCRVMALPGLNEEEARHVFLKSYNRNQTTTTSTHELMHRDVDRVTTSYRFKDSGYHPLTIGAVGARLGRITAADDDQWPQVWEDMSGDFTGPNSAVEKAIKMNFESISERRKHLFLDVAFLYIPCIEKDYLLMNRMFGGSAHLIEEPFILVWLSALYRGKMDKCAIKADLKQLAYDGLLEFEDLEEVHVHDLYTELAAREAAASGRFVEDGMGMNYAEATRLHWNHCFHRPVPNFEKLQFPKLELLIDDLDEERAQWLQADMPHLRMLEIGLKMDCNSDFNLQRVEWEKMPELTWLRLLIHGNWSDFYIHQMLEDISQLRHLLFLSIEGIIIVDSLCLNSLVNLQYLILEWGNSLEEISGLDSLINLKRIVLTGLPDLLNVGVFSSSSTQLEVMVVKNCSKLREIEGLRNIVRNLKELRTSTYDSWWFDHTVMCLNDFVNLQYLIITVGDHIFEYSTPDDDIDNGLREISGLECLIHLKHIDIEAPNLLKVGHFSSRSTQLEHMFFNQCEDLTEIQGLGNLPNLKQLNIGAGYPLLPHENMWRSNDSLEILWIYGGTHCTIKEISFIHGQFPRLELLNITDFPEVQDIDFSKLTSLSNLQELLIRWCYRLEEIDWSCLNNLTNLKRLSICNCTVLKRIKGKPNGINHTLQHLSIEKCSQLEEVEGLVLLKGFPDEQVPALRQKLIDRRGVGYWSSSTASMERHRERERKRERERDSA